MHGSSPLPKSLILLALALPGVLLAGHRLARWLSAQRALRVALTPGLALAIWLLSVHATGLVTRSFIVGLSVGTSGVALAAVAHLIARWRAPASRAPSVGKGPSKWSLLLIVLTTAPIAYMAFGFAFHDEYMYTGHLSISSEIQNDIYPPRHLTFADANLRYHYGFDLFTSCISAICRVDAGVAIDIATVLLWAYTAFLLWVLGDLWFGRGRGWLTLITTLFNGELPISLSEKTFKVQHLIGVGNVKNLWILPPVVSNFFQHPWALGLPLALAALLVFSARSHALPAARLCLLALLLAALSIGHIVLFITVLPSIVAAELWHTWGIERQALRQGAGILAATAGAVTAAVIFGGFCASQSSSGLASTLEFKPGVVQGFTDTLRWNAQSFGLALPIALVGVLFLPRHARVVIMLLLAGSLAVLNTVHYKHSWDIVKFGVVASMAIGLAGAAAVDRLLRVLSGRGFLRRVGRAGLSAVLILSATCGGFAFTFFFELFPKVAPSYFNLHCSEMARDDARAASFIRARVRAGEVVFRREGPAVGYAQWGGLPVPWIDWAVYTFGFPAERIAARVNLLRQLPAEPGVYLAQGIDWFVLGPEDTRLNGHADGWIARGKAAQVAKFGALRVIKLNGT